MLWYNTCGYKLAPRDGKIAGAVRHRKDISMPTPNDTRKFFTRLISVVLIICAILLIVLATTGADYLTYSHPSYVILALVSFISACGFWVSGAD